MNRKMESLDLRDNFGRDHLASALGVGTDAVGALWKQLGAHPEKSRQLALETLASQLSGDYTSNGIYSGVDDSQIILNHLARRYSISPRIVDPLVKYHRAKSEQDRPPDYVQ